MNAKHISDQLQAAGAVGAGQSIHFNGDEPTTGYAIGMIGTELRLHHDMNALSIVRAWAAFNYGTREDTVLGVWVDGDYVYYDVSRILIDRTEAIALGKRNGQLAIWDIDNACEIRLD